MATNEKRSYAGNAPDTTLNADITAGALSFSVESGTGANYPDGTGGPFFIIIDFDTSKAEKVRVTSRSGDTFTIPATDGRGVDTTTAQQHSSGAKVRHIWTATDAAEANNAVVNTIGRITTKGDLLAGTAAGTLGRVAAGADNAVLRAKSAQAAGLEYWTIPVDDVAGTASLRTLGTGGQQAAAGNHTHAAGTVSKTVRVPHTYAYPGTALTATGAQPKHAVPIPAGQTATIVGVETQCDSGSATVNIEYWNGTAWATAATGVAVGTTAAYTAIGQAISSALATGAGGVRVNFTAVSSPANVNVSLLVDYTV